MPPEHSSHQPGMKTSGTKGSSCGQGCLVWPNGSPRPNKATTLPRVCCLAHWPRAPHQGQWALVMQPPGPVAAGEPVTLGRQLFVGRGGAGGGGHSLALMLLWIH